MNRELFVEEVKKLGIDIDDTKLELLEKYYNLLIEWNEKINLTTITKMEDVYLKHFYDSLTLAKEIDFSKDIVLCDVGSGAGFPGIVIKIFFPNTKITLVDSLQKRVNYLNSIIEDLGLKDIIAIHSRMEDYSRLNEEKFDYITARAVADLSVISEVSVRSLKTNGSLVFMKANCDEEIEKFIPRAKKLGLIINNINRFELPIEKSVRTLINLKKVAKTNTVYPRRIDIIKKEYK